MIAPALPANEDRRLAAVRGLGLLDTADEERFDRLTRIAAVIFDVPTVYISLMDENRQWFKSCFGADARETGRDISFCGHAILANEPFIVPDATLDPRFRDNPLVVGPPYIRFYAGIPLATEDDLLVGTLCLVDQHPRTFGQKSIKLFQDVAHLVRDEMNFMSSRQLSSLLAKSEERFLSAFENAAIGMALVGLEGRWLSVNQALCDLVGYSEKELQSKTFQEITHPDDLATDLEHIRQLLAGETRSYFMEKRYLHKQGHAVWILLTVSLVRDLKDKPLHFIAQVQDICARKQAEESLKLFRTLIDQSNDAIEVVDPQTGRFLDANERAWQRLGYSREEFLSIGLSDVTVAKLSMSNIAEEIQRTGSKIVRSRHRRKDGSTFPIEATVQYVRLDRDYLVAVVRDITERTMAEDQIAEQASLLDKTQDAIIVRDLKGKILFWNKGAERMYGWLRQEVLEENLDGFIYANPKQFDEVNDLAIKNGEWSGELQHLKKGGEALTVEARWTLIRDQDGKPKSTLAINTDITEKKKIEAQFLRAQRMESIGTLASGIAHDLNNILAPIMMSIDLLKPMSDKPQAKSILETIEVSAKRGADIVRQVLSFARGLEGERLEIQPKHLLKDLEQIIKDTFPKDIRLQFSVPNETWTILGDPTQIHQVLLNLCVNARDAMPNGGQLTIGVENCELDAQYVAMNPQAKAGRYVKVGVADTGMGIPPALINKIFEPFFTTKDINKGTGLGLSTVMAIVKSHDGTINVYSEQGKGTVFTIYLPAMETSTDARKEQSEQANLPRGNGETVLIIDDEASILTITSQTLEAFGYRVMTATDGADALGLYVQHKAEIAVVLTDMMMPVLDGPATIHALIRINPAIKIIAASGLNMSGGVAKASEAGVKHFLTKPYTAGTLLKTMRLIIDEA